MLAAADRADRIRRELERMHPYVLITNPLLARRRELLQAALEASGSPNGEGERQ